MSRTKRDREIRRDLDLFCREKLLFRFNERRAFVRNLQHLVNICVNERCHLSAVGKTPGAARAKTFHKTTNFRSTISCWSKDFRLHRMSKLIRTS